MSPIVSGQRKKLSSVQAEVVRFIRDEGWELGIITGLRNRAWLQKRGLCRGGETRKVTLATVRSLEQKGYIQRVPRKKKDQYWLVRFELAKGDGGGYGRQKVTQEKETT